MYTPGLSPLLPSSMQEQAYRNYQVGSDIVNRAANTGEYLAGLQAAERARQEAPMQLPSLPEGEAIAQGAMPQAPAAAPAQPAGLTPNMPPAASTAAAQTDKMRNASRKAAKPTAEGRQLTHDEIRQGRNVAGLLKVPAAALDIAATPVSAISGAGSLAARGLNYLFGTNLPTPTVSATPFYDMVRAREQQLATGRAPVATGPTEAERVAETRRSGAVQQAQAPRSVRNNNPGNIEYSDFARSLGATGSDGRFAIFPDAATGQQAQVELLRRYGAKGVNTVEAVVNRWSPQADPGNAPGSTNNYARFVAQRLGVQPNQPLDMNNPQVLSALASAMAQFEGGTKQAAAPAQPAASAVGLPAQQVAAAPAAPAAPQQAAQPTLGAIGLPERELQIAQLQLRQLESMINSTRDVGQRNQLLAKHAEVQQGMFEAQVGQAAQRAARGDEMALSSLAKAVGVPLLRVGDGTYVEAVQGPNGQYVPAQNAQPYTAQQLAALLYQQASSAARAQAQAFNAERQKVMFEGQKAGAIAAAKQPYELQMEQAKLELNIQQKIAEARLRGDEYAGAVPIKDSIGNTTGAIIVYKSGRNERVMAGGGSGQVVAGMSVVQ